MTPKLTPLLPCPFCGKPATWATTHHVACGNESCALGLSEFLCWDHQWNMRAPALSPPGMGEIERLEDLLSRAMRHVRANEDGVLLDEIRAALETTTALAQPREPEGWCAVPIEARDWIFGLTLVGGKMVNGNIISHEAKALLKTMGYPAAASQPPASEGEGK